MLIGLIPNTSFFKFILDNTELEYYIHYACNFLNEI